MLQKVTLPPLQPTQVEVKVLMVGLCHTDVHMRDNDWGTADFPLLTGHEAVCIVTKLGSAVTAPALNSRVAIGWVRDSCSTCSGCAVGRENLCQEGYQGTYLGASSGIWGGSPLRYNEVGGCFARVQRIEARFAIPIPDNVPSEVVCPLICGGGTVYEPIVEYGFPGAVVAVSSIGGLGTAAIKLAKLRGCRVVAISSTPAKEDAAVAAGAESFVCVEDEAAMKAIKGTCDMVLETSPANADIKRYMACLKIGGTFVRVGIPSKEDQAFEYDFIPLIFMQQRVCGSVVTGTKRMREMLELVSENLESMIDGDMWKTENLKMERVNEAMDLLMKRKNKGYRYVLEW